MGKSFTLTERNEIQKMLSKKAGPEFISKRQGQGNQNHSYIVGWHYFELLNHIFGFDGWSSKIMDQGDDYCQNIGTTEQPKWNISTFAHMRLELKDGTYREDVGVGEAVNAKTASAGYKVAKKEAVTDGIKRCFRQFGTIANYLGDHNFKKIIATAKNIPTYKHDPNDFIHLADLHDFIPQLNEKLAQESQVQSIPVPAQPVPVQVPVQQQVQQVPVPAQQVQPVPKPIHPGAHNKENLISNPGDVHPSSDIDFNDGIDNSLLDDAKRRSVKLYKGTTPLKGKGFSPQVLEIISPRTIRKRK